ncbi:hypothetical protein VB774_05225 [Pseudanabaena galeata UHCC 0370]|uniref:SPOR domain-containing protein n=1 Tax=Pseudanabaena galeata UHCC 0370 TaxID=3110310 RepID=A0ABU5TFL6_9CYAN|nr:hypothetical protein [Pseudanabaena galeata]MEA5477015.1 hypothetical protein [Pseudanabaena galeata UHCC 0370]
MQTLSPTISPTISKTSNQRVTNSETDLLPAIAQSSGLQTALAGLDASLNDELDRYRHWQANGQTISYLNPFRPRAVSTQSIWTSPSLSDALSPIAPIVDPTTNGDRRTIQMPVMPPIGSGASTNSSINISTAELHNFQGLEALQSLENLYDAGVEPDLPYAQDMNGYGEATSGSLNSPTMAKIPAPDDDDILQSFANDYADHYQESVDQESAYPIPNAPPEKSALRSLMNPVGIISLLLLLCSSAAIGYLMVDPSGVMKIFKPETKPKAAQTDGKNADLGSDINLQNQQKANDTGISFVPFAGDKPELASKVPANPAIAPKNPLANPSTKPSSLFAPNSAFVPTTPLRTVPSTSLPPISVAPLPPALAPAPVERSYTPPVSRRNYESAPAPARSSRAPAPRPATSRATPAPAPAPSTARATSPTSATAPTPTSVSRANTNSVAPTTVYVTPRPNTAVKYAAPISSAPAPAVSAPVSSYRVVVENSYAASAQQIERDAYVRPSDGRVQIGSYRDPNAAQQRIEQLRRQGIPARIE